VLAASTIRAMMMNERKVPEDSHLYALRRENIKFHLENNNIIITAVYGTTSYKYLKLQGLVTQVGLDPMTIHLLANLAV
jgi:uncharacterized protein (UPF0276 family)